MADFQFPTLNALGSRRALLRQPITNVGSLAYGESDFTSPSALPYSAAATNPGVDQSGPLSAVGIAGVGKPNAGSLAQGELASSVAQNPKPGILDKFGAYAQGHPLGLLSTGLLAAAAAKNSKNNSNSMMLPLMMMMGMMPR